METNYEEKDQGSSTLFFCHDKTDIFLLRIPQCNLSSFVNKLSYIHLLLTISVSTQSLTHIVGFPGETDPLVHRVQLTSTGAPPPAPGGSASASAPSKRGDFGLSAGRRSANGGEASTCHLCLRHTTLSLRTLLYRAIYLCSVGEI